MDKEGLTKTLEKATANAYDVYFDLYTKYFESGDSPEEALEIILDYPGKIGDTEDNNPQYIKRKDARRITIAFDEWICGTANRIAEFNYPKKEFYQKLYATVFCSDNVIAPQSKEEKVIALKILSERAVAVPYYQLYDVENISETEFDKIMQQIHPQLHEAFCMLQRPFSTMPEMVSQLLRIADCITDRRLRIVFWTITMSKFKNIDRN